MNCRVIPLRLLDAADTAWILERLSRPGSDFQKKLIAGNLTEADGKISIVADQGEIIGWARTEEWRQWQTLEAFVDTHYRRRGVATFAAAGLTACGIFEKRIVAVFRPSMSPLAERVGLMPVRFEKRCGSWVLSI